MTFHKHGQLHVQNVVEVLVNAEKQKFHLFCQGMDWTAMGTFEEQLAERLRAFIWI